MKIILLIFIGLITVNGDKVISCDYYPQDNRLKLSCDLRSEVAFGIFDLNKTEFQCGSQSPISKSVVKSIRFTNCKLRELPDLRSYQNLEYFIAEHMSLTNLRIDLLQGLPKLTGISVENNSLSGDQHLGKLKKLIDIDLSHNPIRIIPDDFNSLTSLKTLYMKNTLLENINPKAFRNLTKINALDFSDNKLKTFNLNIFAASNQKLEEVLLHNNKINHLEQVHRKIYPKLSCLSIYKNPIGCKHLRSFMKIGEFAGNIELSNDYRNMDDVDDAFSIEKINNNPNLENVCIPEK